LLQDVRNSMVFIILGFVPRGFLESHRDRFDWWLVTVVPVSNTLTISV
jgi:hypothetical protein